MKGFKSIVLSSFLVTMSSWGATPLPCGWYIEGNWGASKATGKDYPGVPTIDNTGTGWSANAGYKFMPYLAAEGGYTRYGATRLQSDGVTIADDNHYAIDIAGKAILPLFTSGFELFAKLGVARVNSSIGSIHLPEGSSIVLDTGDKSGTGLFVGGGVAYSFIPNLVANIQWEEANGNNKTGNLSLLSIGISFILDPSQAI